MLLKQRLNSRKIDQNEICAPHIPGNKGGRIDLHFNFSFVHITDLSKNRYLHNPVYSAEYVLNLDYYYMCCVFKDVNREKMRILHGCIITSNNGIHPKNKMFQTQ